MDTFDDDGTTTIADGLPPLGSRRQRRGSRLGMFSSVAIVTALAVVAFAVFTQLGQHRGTGGGASGNLTWTNVLSGYDVSQLISAPGQPGILYACVSKWSPVTSVVNVPGGTYTNPSFTVLRSADGGLTWAATLRGAELAGNCQIALNPANSQEIYVESEPMTVPSNGQVGAFLLHSTDGGRTFSRVNPVLLPLSASADRTIWSVEDLQLDGNRLFGLAAVSQSENPSSSAPPPAAEPQLAFSVESLVMSSDGGRTWSVLDGEFQPAELEVRGYAVNPAHPDTIYMVVGRPVGPVLYQGPHQPALPAFPPQPANVSGDLYRTTTGGQQWTRVLSSLPYGATVRLGQGTVNSSGPLVYVGGTPSPTPLVAPSTAGASASNTPSSSVSAALTGAWDGFHLQVSADGGLTWHQAPAPPVQVYFDLWLVGPNGDIYIYQGGYFRSYSVGTTVTGSSGSGSGSGSSTGSTTVIDTPGTLPPVSSGSPGTPTTVPGAGDTPPTPVHSLPPATPMSGSNLPVTPTATGSATGTNLAYRYDPATNQWSGVPMPAHQGVLLAVTGSSTSQTALWFLSEDNQQASLYRRLA